MREIKKIIVHCSATDETQDFGVDEIRRWHTDPKPAGNGWSDVGYHYVINRRGDIQQGRPIDKMGAHAYGHNDDSIGVCLVGGINSKTKNPDSNFTMSQYQSLVDLRDKLINSIPSINETIGHNEISDKSCPCFNMRAFFS